ncbi:D-alanyl-D-alanine carboxypeptidase (penicillin-binding protein 5/6) [Alkalihalobacillus xiaoxiensis]|uniref:D-alanyl-D-alanine carboxypeptidase (Penicillin-binding protein 5/6) n=1 Tax=Shouchella xiaoxiensis TaxID=766895 RepID=A0ABS2STA6_9BACI|nr:serine hydrolase [Shouchella xiaoxiensis]MBM7838738.1 D-alanyl-D-alanine carboxypeptidase (penicillin-binding protein 5/6) [Shouchella xiaoxiensis]
MRSYTAKEKIATAIVLVIVACTLWVMESSYSFTGGFKSTDSFQKNIHSEHGILMERGTGTIIHEKNADERMYPASLTKIMTVLVAIEQSDDLNEETIVTGEIHAQLSGTNAAMAGFASNEQVELIDLMYGVMLPSGAEASLALATYLAGNETSYVKRMNEKASQLGLNDTHFTNVTGLHDTNHYTTSRDMLLLLNDAMNNDVFRKVFTAAIHTTQPSFYHPNGLTLTSTLFSKIPETSFSDGALLGGKTGYTKEAGLCLASLALINGKEYLLITAQAKGNHHTDPYHIEDALYVYGNLIRN